MLCLRANVSESSKQNFWDSSTNNIRLIRCKQGIDDRKPGHKPAFSQKVEKKMVKAALDAAQMGLGLSGYQFMAKAGECGKIIEY